MQRLLCHLPPPLPSFPGASVAVSLLLFSVSAAAFALTHCSLCHAPALRSFRCVFGRMGARAEGCGGAVNWTALLQQPPLPAGSPGSGSARHTCAVTTLGVLWCLCLHYFCTWHAVVPLSALLLPWRSVVHVCIVTLMPLSLCSLYFDSAISVSANTDSATVLMLPLLLC